MGARGRDACVLEGEGGRIGVVFGRFVPQNVIQVVSRHLHIAHPQIISRDAGRAAELARVVFVFVRGAGRELHPRAAAGVPYLCESHGRSVLGAVGAHFFAERRVFDGQGAAAARLSGHRAAVDGDAAAYASASVAAGGIHRTAIDGDATAYASASVTSVGGYRSAIDGNTAADARTSVTSGGGYRSAINDDISHSYGLYAAVFGSQLTVPAAGLLPDRQLAAVGDNQTVVGI